MLKTTVGKLIKRRSSRTAKLAAVLRVNEGMGVGAVTEELTVRHELLHGWYQRWRSGGSDALRAMGRPSANGPRSTRHRRRPRQEQSSARSRNWNAKLAGSSWNWIFFGLPCGMLGNNA